MRHDGARELVLLVDHRQHVRVGEPALLSHEARHVHRLPGGETHGRSAELVSEPGKVEPHLQRRGGPGAKTVAPAVRCSNSCAIAGMHEDLVMPVGVEEGRKQVLDLGPAEGLGRLARQFEGCVSGAVQHVVVDLADRTGVRLNVTWTSCAAASAAME